MKAIRTRMLSVFFGVIVIFVGTITVMWHANNAAVNDALTIIAHDDQMLSHFQKFAYDVRSAEADGAWYLMDTNKDGPSYLGHYQTDIAQAQNELKAITVLDKTDSPALQKIFQVDIATFQIYWQSFLMQNTTSFSTLASGLRTAAQDSFVTYSFQGAVDDLMGFTSKIEQHRADLQAVLQRDMATAQNTAVIGSVLAVALAILFGLLLNEQIVSDIRMAMKIAMQMAQGDFVLHGHRKARLRETGLLMDSLEKMRCAIAGLVMGIQSQAEEVATTTREMNQVTKEAAASSGQLADIAAQVSQSAENQVVRVEQVDRMMREVTTIISSVAQSADGTASLAEDLVQHSKSGAHAVAAAVSEIDLMRANTDLNAERIADLGDKSMEIGSIVDLINELTEQTNLLSLNAAIEAARAGEQGRGFAVVADEVRHLAERSRDAAERIRRLIEEMRANIADSIRSVTEGKAQVGLGARAMQRVDEVFALIQASAEQVFGHIENVRSATEQMSMRAEHVQKTFGEISDLSHHVTNEILNVSATVQEQTAANEEISSATSELSQGADTLLQHTKGFQVSQAN